METNLTPFFFWFFFFAHFQQLAANLLLSLNRKKLLFLFKWSGYIIISISAEPRLLTRKQRVVTDDLTIRLSDKGFTSCLDVCYTLWFSVAQLCELGQCVFFPTYFLICGFNLVFSSFLFLSLNTASKARRPYQFSGKITVKAKEKSYSKLEIPYQAEVLEG